MAVVFHELLIHDQHQDYFHILPWVMIEYENHHTHTLWWVTLLTHFTELIQRGSDLVGSDQMKKKKIKLSSGEPLSMQLAKMQVFILFLSHFRSKFVQSFTAMLYQSINLWVVRSGSLFQSLRALKSVQLIKTGFWSVGIIVSIPDRKLGAWPQPIA